MMERDRHPCFDAAAWSVAEDLIRLSALLQKGNYFLALPSKIRRQGPTEHWKTRNRKKELGNSF